MILKDQRCIALAIPQVELRARDKAMWKPVGAGYPIPFFWLTIFVLKKVIIMVYLDLISPLNRVLPQPSVWIAICLNYIMVLYFFTVMRLINWPPNGITLNPWHCHSWYKQSSRHLFGFAIAEGSSISRDMDVWVAGPLLLAI